jgi:hypothetical protein
LHVVAHTKSAAEFPYLALNADVPVWQLGTGWRSPDDAYHWMKLEASAWVRRPAGAKYFEVVVNVGPELIEAVSRVRFEVWLDGTKAGEREFNKKGWVGMRFEAPAPAPDGRTRVTFKASPGYFPPGQAHEPDNAYGLAIGAFGYPELPLYPAIEVPQ